MQIECVLIISAAPNESAKIINISKEVLLLVLSPSNVTL